jgi:hypothetical protein
MSDKRGVRIGGLKEPPRKVADPQDDICDSKIRKKL